MRRILIFQALVLVLITILLPACEEQDSKDVLAAVANIQVIEKGIDGEASYWVRAVYPVKSSIKEEMKIFIEDKKVWNLIDVDRKYTAHYAKDTQDVYHLYSIDLI